MAVREVWFGSMGPYIFDDTVQWPDGEYRVGARVPQVFLDDEPTEPEHAVRLSTLGDYPTESEVQSIVLSEGVVRSGIDSGLESKVGSTVIADSALDSKALSLSANASTLDSVVDSNGVVCSNADSTLTSKTTSLATQTSAIESKMLSGVFE